MRISDRRSVNGITAMLEALIKKSIELNNSELNNVVLLMHYNIFDDKSNGLKQLKKVKEEYPHTNYAKFLKEMETKWM